MATKGQFEMTAERVSEIVHQLLKERKQPMSVVNVLPPDPKTMLVAVRFGARVETQCLVHPASESEESVPTRLGRWLDIESRASARAVK